jgi:hypothetical protein
LIPSHELEHFAELLRSGRADAADVVYNEMSSLYGHDAFFKELSWLVRNSQLTGMHIARLSSLQFVAGSTPERARGRWSGVRACSRGTDAADARNLTVDGGYIQPQCITDRTDDGVVRVSGWTPSWSVRIAKMPNTMI